MFNLTEVLEWAFHKGKAYETLRHDVYKLQAQSNVEVGMVAPNIAVFEPKRPEPKLKKRKGIRRAAT